MSDKTAAPNTPEKRPNRPLQLTSDNSTRVKITRRLAWLLGDLVFTWTTCKINAVGLEHIPRTGPTMILFNHLTMVDPIMAGIKARFRPNIPIGKIELNDNPLIRLLAWAWDSVSIKREELDMTALRRALLVLESSDMLSIAPEGTRHKDGLHSPKEGFVMLAAKANAVMVPVGVTGTEHWRTNLKRLRRTPITVKYGRPLRLKGKITRQQNAAVADELMYQIAALIDPHLRGEYSDLTKATMNYLEYADG